MALNINGTTGISGVDGSVSAPALTGTDSNTGITFPSADTIKFSTGGVERMQITNSGVSSSGHILQVVQTVKTDTFSASSGSTVDITGLSVSITPSSSSNKVLVTYDTNVSMANGSYHAHVFLVRGSTKIYLGDADGSKTRSSNFVISGNDGNGGILHLPCSWRVLRLPLQQQVQQHIRFNYMELIIQCTSTEHNRSQILPVAIV